MISDMLTGRHSIFLERRHVPITRMPDDSEAHYGQLGDVDANVSFGLDTPYALEHDVSTGLQKDIPRKLWPIEPDKYRDQTAGGCLAEFEYGEIIRDLLNEVGAQLLKPYGQERFGRRIGRHAFEQVLA
jgi:hypothetical protein